MVELALVERTQVTRWRAGEPELESWLRPLLAEPLGELARLGLESWRAHQLSSNLGL